MSTRKSLGRGGVRELSYDPAYARPHGQTEAQIKRDAQRARPRVVRSDRYFVLRFLGLARHAALELRHRKPYTG